MPTAENVRSARREKFGHRLRELRLAQGLTQEQVALAAGMDRAFYVDLENARHGVLVDRLDDIAGALGVTRADLVTY